MLPKINLHGRSTFLLLFVLFSYTAFTQQNYIRVYVPQTEVSPGTGLNSGNSLINISYYDSAGRLIQTVQQGITPSGNDMANHIVYDDQNRKECEWQSLPFPTSDGLYKPLSAFELSEHKDYYHVEYEYEPSVLNRVIAETGRNSKGKSIYTEYLMNTSATSELSVYQYKYHSDTSIKNVGMYPDGFLNCIKQTDEDGNILYTFTNPEKKVILQRHTHAYYSENYDTYYIYDKLDELFCVLPPAASEALQSTSAIYSLQDNEILDQYAYFYHYDEFNNCIATKLPGSGWYHTVYDGDSRPVLKQSPNQRSRSEWTFIKYDGLNRIILEGTVLNTQSHENLIKDFGNILVKEEFNANTPYGYTENIRMGSSVRIHKAFYYDYYDFIDLPLFSDLMTSRPSHSHVANSLQTGSYIATLDAQCDYEVSVSYYDRRGRSIQTDSYNSASITNTLTTSNYNFVNNPVNQHTTYITPMEICSEKFSFDYDHAGREISSSLEVSLSSGKQGINKTYSLQSQNYDEFGRISHKNLFNNKDHVTTTYRADGKLGNTAGRLFSQDLYYDESKLTPYGEQYFNGRISSIATRQCDNSYRFFHQYDYAGRLSSAMMYDFEGNRYLRFKEEIGYDKMGNITSLYRTTPKGDVNVLSLSYNGNQIVSTEDYSSSRWPDEYGFLFCRWSKEANAYLYDDNGNESRNTARDMLHARYNNLNLPDSVCFSGGNTLQISYLSNGRRLRTTSKTYRTALTIPLDDLQYLSDPSAVHEEIQDGNLLFRDGYLSELRIPGGYISLRNDTTKRSHVQPYYYITDYLGSVRATCDGETGHILQSLEYFPSGAVFRRTGYDVQNRKFCGKEELAMHGFDMYYSQARLQYTRIPRFSTMDPLMEGYYHLSPYSYCGNDFINAVDPTGNYVESAWDVASLAMGVKSFVSNVKGGNVLGAVVDGVGIVLDAAATALPVIPGGAGAAIKGVRAIDKAVDAAKTADKAVDGVSAMKRGIQNEAKVLESIGEVKNTAKKTVRLQEYGKEITVIPDAITDTKVIEIKDVKSLSNTKQIRGERQVAQKAGKDFTIITGEKTHVSKKIPTEEIVRRSDIGPQ